MSNWTPDAMKRVNEIAADTVLRFRKELSPPEAGLCVAQILAMLIIEANGNETAFDAVILNAREMFDRYRQARS